MIQLFNIQEFEQAKSKTKLPCECYMCKSTFYLEKENIMRALNPNQAKKANFCTLKCSALFFTKEENVNCKNCDKEFSKKLNQIKKHPNHFCSRSCAATHNNKNKTHGTRRSKLEIYIEEQLIVLYPNLHIDFNKKEAINSELDIYIPSLKLAFELNGLFHFEPIFGENKLSKIQNNDERKFQACIEQQISLCIIDTSKQKYFKKSTSEDFLNIIINIINNKSKNNKYPRW